MRASSKSFDYSQNFKEIDFRVHPELYQVGKGEQGVLMVEPYKSEILPYWRFKTPDVAQQSADKIYELFLDYKRHGDFVGMDMARKFLQMGYTRSRRYANHQSGRKYQANPQKEHTHEAMIEARKQILPQAEDNEKAESARIFYGVYLLARNDEEYQQLKKQHVEKYERKKSPEA
ncbi:hypothetical protein KDA_62820 [Dictyobacter alpinus]|uniref:DUF4385 domain-containing protein n=1 Tax=Dictyobacter alpinus TaxID=2014873 RepID=A0A402BH95_9CHLR|nr:DUF4385 domain-containing protein [Dictyobacter alpinus]GCE30798.1 hypothetical protein KDA_62820 [Dictyobacter alpinus]